MRRQEHNGTDQNVLTRMGWNTKMIITGDDADRTCLTDKRADWWNHPDTERYRGIEFIEMTKSDIVRHKLVTNIVNAYEKHDREFGKCNI